MATTLNYLAGKDFVRKVLAGERDFSRTKLEEGFDLTGHEGFSEMQMYLKNTNLNEVRLNLNDSEWRQVTARELHLPFFNGKNVDLYKANLRGANLYKANFGGANLYKANFGGADLYKANLGGADLRGVTNLGNTKNLQDAIFDETIVTEVEKAIIEECLKKRRLFVVK